MATNRRTGAGRVGPRSRTNVTDHAALAQAEGRITALEPQQQNPRRRSLFVDGQFVTGLDLEVVVLAKLKVGQSLTGPLLIAAVQADEEKRAWDASLRLLSAAGRSRRELERRLVRTYSAAAVERVLDRLEAGNWLNDAEFARQYCASRTGYGERRLLQDLIRRGVAKPVALAAVQAAVGDADGVEMARGLAVRRLAAMRGADRESARRRLSGYLARRGYDFETVSKALSPLLKDLPSPPRTLGKRGGGLRRRTAEEE